MPGSRTFVITSPAIAIDTIQHTRITYSFFPNVSMIPRLLSFALTPRYMLCLSFSCLQFPLRTRPEIPGNPGKRTKLSSFPGSFFLYNSHEVLPGNRVFFVLLSKCNHAIPDQMPERETCPDRWFSAAIRSSSFFIRIPDQNRSYPDLPPSTTPCSRSATQSLVEEILRRTPSSSHHFSNVSLIASLDIFMPTADEPATVQTYAMKINIDL